MMIFELIKTENYLLVVSDEKPTTEREWVYDTVYGTEFKDVRKATTIDTTKIIAHLPLNGAPYLDGVDVLPEIEDESLSQLSMQKFPNHEDMDKRVGYIIGILEAKETYKYTEGDLRRAILFGQGMELWKEEEQIDKFIQSLNQPKLPVAFECEMVNFEVDMGLGEECIEYGQYPKTITTLRGTEWVGKYEF